MHKSCPILVTDIIFQLCHKLLRIELLCCNCRSIETALPNYFARRFQQKTIACVCIFFKNIFSEEFSEANVWTSSNAGQTGCRKSFLRCNSLMSRESLHTKVTAIYISSMFTIWIVWFCKSSLEKYFFNIHIMGGWATNVHVCWLPNFPDMTYQFNNLLHEKLYDVFNVTQIFLWSSQDNLLQENIYEVSNFPQIFSWLFRDEVFPKD